KRVFYINKEAFLLAFKDAFLSMFIAFKAIGLVPLNAQVVLNYFNMRIRTLLGPLPLETP
ncbi:hypothetical protein CC80DRAFT_414348, partial [Byssothecium circinans]